MPEPVVLKSSGVGFAMKIILWVCIGMVSLLLGLSLFMLLAGSGGRALMTVSMGILGVFVLGLLPLMVLTMVWVVLFHRDLKAVFPDYPMSPLRAVLYMFIPLFNLYGLWRTFASISEYLRASGGQAGQVGDRANVFSTLGYLSIYVGNALYFFAMEISPSGQAGTDPKVFLAQVLASTCFVVFYLNSIRLSQKSLEIRAREGVALDTREVLTYMR